MKAGLSQVLPLQLTPPSLVVDRAEWAPERTSEPTSSIECDVQLSQFGRFSEREHGGTDPVGSVVKILEITTSASDMGAGMGGDLGGVVRVEVYIPNFQCEPSERWREMLQKQREGCWGHAFPCSEDELAEVGHESDVKGKTDGQVGRTCSAYDLSGCVYRIPGRTIGTYLPMYDSDLEESSANVQLWIHIEHLHEIELQQEEVMPATDQANSSQHHTLPDAIPPSADMREWQASPFSRFATRYSGSCEVASLVSGCKYVVRLEQFGTYQHVKHIQ